VVERKFHLAIFLRIGYQFSDQRGLNGRVAARRKIISSSVQFLRGSRSWALADAVGEAELRAELTAQIDALRPG
jgi:hypothetical protein